MSAFTLRRNDRLYPVPWLTLGAEGYAKVLVHSPAGPSAGATGCDQPGEVFHWQWRFIDEDEVIADLRLDRLWAQFQRGKVQLTAGRQRIAWGTCLVWNPIDLFNPASPFDFENEERPGADGLRAEVFLGPVSSLQFAWTGSRGAAGTAAALLRANLCNTDLYLLLARKPGASVAGLAWAGQIADGGFRGEVLAVEQDDESLLAPDYVLGALSYDYTFSNSTYLHFEALMNTAGAGAQVDEADWLRTLANDWLTPARRSLFGEISLLPHPLLSTSLAAIYNPFDRSRYFGPNFRASVLSNLDLSLAGLLFEGRKATEFGAMPDILFVRLKYSF